MTHPVNLTPVADAISAGAIVGAFAHILPPLAAFIAIFWYALEIYESRTVQGFLSARRRRWMRRQRIIKRLRAKPPRSEP